MFFLIDRNTKIIFGWSAKCGCSHVKRIFWFLKTNNINNNIHTVYDKQKIPSDIKNYTTIVFSRNPYKRLVSGFLEKYYTNGRCRSLWKHDNITFSKFIDELLKNNWKMIDKHHFTPQTSENFSKNNIIMSKCLKIFDIENIDYDYIEKLYNKKIPEEILNHKEGHYRKYFNTDFTEYVYNLDMTIYYNNNIDVKYFYNEDLKNKVYKFYKNDFIFFNENGIDYNI